MFSLPFRSLRDKSPARSVRRRMKNLSASPLRSAVETLEHRTLLSATLGGTTYEDQNGDGVQNAGEEALAGVTVYLDVNDNGVLDQEPNTLSDANGQYAFANLAAGDYVVRQVVPDGFKQTSPVAADPRLFALRSSNETIVELDPQNGNILNSFLAPGGPFFSTNGLAFDGNTLFYVDANGNTLFEIDPDTGAVRDSFNLTTIIPDARYDGLAAIDGEVYVNAPPTGRIFVLDTETNSLARTIQFEQASNIAPFGAIGEVVFNGETVLTGAIGASSSIVLLDPQDPTATFGEHLGLIRHGTATTTDQGLTGIGDEIYVGFNDLAGTVQVLKTDGTLVRTFQAGFAISGLGGSNGSANGGAHRITLADGAAVTGLDFGNQPLTGKLRGTIFSDADGDGVQDTGENGQAGVTVYLDQNNNNALDAGERSTQTDAAGEYFFRDLPEGEYIVRQLTPTRHQQTSPTFTDSYYAHLYVPGGAMQMGRINAQTGEVQRFGTPQTSVLQRMHGLVRTNDGQFFGINGFDIDSLASVDLATSEVTRIGNLTVNGQTVHAAFGLAYDPATNTLYGVLQDPTDRLYKLAVIDRATGAATLMGPGTQLLTGTTGIAFDTDRNVVVAFDTADDQFVQFDLNGTPTLLWDTLGLDGWGLAYNGEEFVLHARNFNNGDTTLTNRLMWRIDPYQQTIQNQFFTVSEPIGLESLDYYRVEDGHLVYVGQSEVLEGLDFGNQFLNTNPTAENDSATTNEDGVITIDVLANDSDAEGDSLTVSVVTQGANGNVAINPDNTLTYTPNTNFNGSDSFTYTISDGNGGQAIATVQLTVNAVNDNPTAGNDSATTTEDVSVTINVLANDQDLDGDSLAIAAITQGANGNVAINPDNTLTYTPNTNFNGSDSFTYTISDGNGGQATATVQLTVNAVNDNPTAGDDSATTTEDVAVTIDVLANDQDVDGDALTVSAITQGANGSVAINPDKTLTYTPNANFHGGDSFTYTIRDGNGGQATATVSLTVNSINDNPLVENDSATTNEDVAITIDVLANDQDVDGDALTVSAITQGANGSVAINPDGTLIYTPNANFNGSDSFTYTISDGNGGQATATVSLTVTAVNDNPTAGNDSATTDENVAVTIDVLANDQDVDGDALAVTSVAQGANGSVVINPDGTLTYTPNAGFDGEDVFTYTIGDGNGGEATATVEVSVNDVLDVPAIRFDEGTLTITGTEGDDHIKLRQQGQTLFVSVASPFGNINETFTGVTLIVINSKAGNDKVMLQKSVTIDAEIQGGDGDDHLTGGSGHNLILGGQGNDHLAGGDEDDVLDGGEGDDHLQGKDGDDLLLGGLGKDRLQGGKGNNQVFENPVEEGLLAELFADLDWLWS